MAPGCLGAKGTSLSEPFVLLRLMLGTAQVAVGGRHRPKSLGSCQFGKEGTSVAKQGASYSTSSLHGHVPGFEAGTHWKIKLGFS